MDKKKIVQQIIQSGLPIRESATAYAPANVALIKYWGKADINLNIPITDSLSLSLGHLGTTMCVAVSNDDTDRLILNNLEINKSSIIFKRLQEFLDLVRPKASFYFKSGHPWFKYDGTETKIAAGGSGGETGKA